MIVAVTVSELAGGDRVMYFPQFDTPVEPDDGAEGKRWKHALSSSKNLGTSGVAWEKILPVDGTESLALHGQVKWPQCGNIFNPLFSFQISTLRAGFTTDLQHMKK